MVTPAGRVVILDFGLVSDRTRSTVDATAEGTIMGTPAYMAPEQAGGRRARPASDWYAVGVMLFEALTGALPFSGAPLQMLVHKQMEDAPSPRSLLPGVPEDLDALCADLLQRDPDARPSGEEVLRRLGSQTRARPPRLPAAPSPRFVGRNAELRDLERALGDVRAGSAVLALVHGRSGMGKSALVHHFADELGCDVVVLSGRCYERESVPYKAFDSLVDGLATHLRLLPRDEVRALLPRDVSELACLFPALLRVESVCLPRDDGGRTQRERLARAYAALRELLGAIARRAPLVLTIDDLQWGDADSARLLEALLSPPSPPAVLIIGTYRAEEAEPSPHLRDIVGLAAFSVSLLPLDAAETEELARSLLSADAGDGGAAARARAISREAGGIPFFVSELARWSSDTSGEREPSLDLLVARRLGRLPADARRLLELTAVAGRPTPQRILLDAAGSPDGQAALRLLRAEGLIRTQGVRDSDVVETYHDRIREGTVAALAPATLTAHHQRLAEVFEAAGADAEVLARHYLAAGDRKRGGVFVLSAAEEAARALAFHHAAELYAQRIDLDEGLLGSDPSPLDAVRVKLADALAQGGRGPEAARAYLAAATRAAPDVALDLRRRAAEQLLISGHIGDGLAALDGVLHAVGMKIQASPNRALVSFLACVARLRLRGLAFRERAEADIDRAELLRVDACFTAAAGLTFGDPIRGADFQAQHLLLALRAGEPARVALGLANHAAFLATEGGSARERVDGLLETATALAVRVDNPRAIGRSKMSAGTIAFFQGRFRDAVTTLDDTTRFLRERCTGVAWELDGAELWARTALVFLGDLAELERRATAQLADATARGDRFAEAWIRAAVTPYHRLAADDPRGARASVARALTFWEGSAFLAIHFLALWHEVLADLYDGGGVGALERLSQQWQAAERSLLLRIQVCRVILVWLRAVAAIVAAKGDAGSAHLRAAERDAKDLVSEGMPYAEGMAWAVRAGVAAVRGKRPAAAELLRAAVERSDALEMALFAACARRRLAELSGDDVEAAKLHQAASAYFAAQRIQRPERWTAIHAPGPPSAP